jgi:hypothetical protein
VLTILAGLTGQKALTFFSGFYAHGRALLIDRSQNIVKLTKNPTEISNYMKYKEILIG